MKIRVIILSIIFILVFLILGYKSEELSTLEKQYNNLEKEYDILRNKSNQLEEEIISNKSKLKEKLIITDKNQEVISIVLEEGITIGYFDCIDFGDYTHFIMKDIEGESISFFVHWSLDIDRYIIDDQYKGKKVKVGWQKVKTYILEGGDYYEIVEMINLQEID